MQDKRRPPGRHVRYNLHPPPPMQDGCIEDGRATMDSDMRRIEISIVGDLKYRQIILLGGG